ncbi:dgtp triphosphohydrolase (plasmid) [Candidatus Burkholderia crenata]|nr:dgtp triphosphohydrolase [Candidatus Burkholderia crenata]
MRCQIGRDSPIERLALLFIDLDNFKRINDALGHETGDELLQNVARRLAIVAGKERLFARVGGDEFVLIVDGMGASIRARNLAKSIIDVFELAFGLRGSSYVIRVSIGIAVYTDTDDAEYDLLRQADLAMYAAKGEGKPANMSKCQVYTPDLATRAMRNIARQQDLQYAILNGEFFFEYQPIVSLSTGEIRGVEVLARWRYPEKGTVMPADFIPFAESTGFIVPIGELVLEQACAQFSEWQESDPRPLCLSVNVSAAQLVHEDLVRVLHRCLNQYMIDLRRLQLEITETAILEDSAAVTRLKELRLSGVRVVLDDFGTGYSSLSQLTSLVIDGVKIDRSFTPGVPGDKAAIATFNALPRSRVIWACP